jgi:spore germination protein YaaH
VRPLGLATAGQAGATPTALPNNLRKEVFGFLPYWMLDAELPHMQYQLVSTIAYFGIAARSNGTLATGTVGWNGWYSAAMTNVINAAHARGVKVVLTVTMMAYDGGAQQAALLGSATNRANLIAAIVASVRARNADGVNLDFEPVAVAQRDQYTSFVRQLKAALVAGGVGSHLTVCTMAGAATWATGYDLAGLVAAGAANAVFVMGYDFSWSGSARAGGVAPMESPYILDVNQSIGDYLEVIPASKVIWGVPYYGRTWRTQTSALNSPTRPGASSTSVAWYYPANLNLAATHGRLWDPVGRVPWFRYYDSAAASWVQGYYDDATSLAAKWDMVNQRGLLGTGMWALLMDAGRQELWNLIANKFVNDTAAPTGGISALPPVTDASAIPVSWRAVDVGSGLLSYTVQVRDRAGGSWTNWMTNTTVTSGSWIGQPGHTYEFRVSAIDRKGNRQAWLGSLAPPPATLTIGRFASVVVDTLNVRAGAGTGFALQAALDEGDRMLILSGPIAAGGYSWYQVQYGWTEWPSADYPHIGWAAAGLGSEPYLAPVTAPTQTTLSPTVTDVAVSPARFSPNGDGVADGLQVAFSLPRDASAARLDMLNAAGAVVAGTDLGPLSAGAQVATWDGRLTDGSWAPAGAYLPRVTITDALGVHRGPATTVDTTVLVRWGATADLTAPTMAARFPTGDLAARSATVSVTFSEAVTGTTPLLRLVDTTTETPVPATATWNATTRKATLDPVADLEPDRDYRVEVDPSVRDAAGNPVSPASWTFGTAPVGVVGFEPWRSIAFAAGAHTGYRFDAAGQVTATKTFSLSRASSAATSQRNTILPGQPGAWLYVENGVWAGFWIRESTRSYVPGEVDRVTFAPSRIAAFAGGSHTGYKFTVAGAVSASKTFVLNRASSASTSARAVINGRAYLLIVNGVWAGYWMPESTRVVLR